MNKDILQILSKPPTEQTTLKDVLVKTEPKEEKTSVNVEISEKEEDENSEYDGDKFLIISSYGELLDVAIHLEKIEKKLVMFYVPEKDYAKIGEGIVQKCDNWHEYLGKGWIWVVDGCEHAGLQDWLREQGEMVVGTNKIMSELEEDRQKGQKWFEEAGFNQPESFNFTDIDEAIDFVSENTNKRWVLKQNGSAPKSVNHVGKFEGSEDMLYHLNELKKKWNENEYGAFDCDLMECVEGVEIAASAFFNGSDWLRDKNGKVVGFLNFEEKKETDGALGETTGETGTTFYGCDETNPIFKDILLREELVKTLKDSDYRGVFDINGSITDKGFIAFEATSRFGIPATSYEFIEGLKTPLCDLLCAMATGESTSIEIQRGWGMVMVVCTKPYPVEYDLPGAHSSIGEKLWILQDGKPIEDFTKEQLNHIHLENFYKDDEGEYKVATANGYLLTVTGIGANIESMRKSLIEYIKENLYISGNKYRQDIGKRIEEYI
jgi:phosphoribosylamine-glycine ligase